MEFLQKEPNQSHPRQQAQATFVKPLSKHLVTQQQPVQV
jgi:hypothetical protein